MTSQQSSGNAEKDSEPAREDVIFYSILIFAHATGSLDKAIRPLAKVAVSCTLAGGLTDIRSMREAVRCPGSIYWDFAQCRAFPGRVWHEHLPSREHELMMRGFTPAEHQRTRQICGIDRVNSTPHGSKPKVLIVIGPSAAGKTTVLPEICKFFGIDLDSFVNLDGDDMRGCHGEWKRLVEDDNVNGFRDAYSIYIRNKANKNMKQTLSQECLKARKNVVFPWTNIDDDALQLIKANAYEVYVAGLLISCVESDTRQKNRAQKTGRWSSTPVDKWQTSIAHLELLVKPEISNMAVVYDSTDVHNLRMVYSRGSPLQRDVDDLKSTLTQLMMDA